MDLERAAMKGRLAEAVAKLSRLKLKAEGLCGSIRQSLNTALTPVEDIELAIVVQVFDELVMTYAEIAGLQGEIARLERELK